MTQAFSGLQLRKRAEAAAIEAEALTAAAVRLAAAAAPHTQLAEPCCSDDNDFEPRCTVTRVRCNLSTQATSGVLTFVIRALHLYLSIHTLLGPGLPYGTCLI